MIGAWPTVIAYKDKKLKGNCSFKLKMEYAAIAAEGDHLLNSISTLHQDTLLSDDASVDVVKRSLEGTVWIDKDKDGKLEDGEKRVENVKVIILKKNGDCYESFEAYEEVVQDGDIYKTITHPTTITTDKNGHYKFEGLPEGEYTVVFESSDQTSLEKYQATIANQGSDKESSKVTS
ncbi:SdrD B-like domain-containing protein, partial [Faecalibacillus intestinalis]|uniref:SdrD B-like domain-containing protein n=1 Tax=Faecalibacillus intestinalis TaxID=1982626 RepID=UPI003992CCC2